MQEREAFDVAVLGGGSAGVAAALGAAAVGARTLLVERCASLGGNVAQAYVHTICGLYHAAGEAEDAPPVPAHEGLCRELPGQLIDRGAARAPERAGRVWVLPLSPLGYAGHLADLVAAQSGLECRTETRLSALQLSHDPAKPSWLELARGGESQRVGARAVVDASGDGVSGCMGGADSERAAASELQRPSFIFRLEGVDTGTLAGFGRLRLSAAVAGAERAGRLPAGSESVLARPGTSPGEAYVTLNLPPLDGEEFDPQADPYRERMEQRGRELAQQIAAFLRERHEAFRHASIASFPNRLGVREGSRLLGRCVIGETDILEGRRREDEVAISTWPVELWQDHRRAQLRYPADAASIPLGALVSRSHCRLAMAGRCLSASHEALGALRVIGTALATGEAAGRAAALAVDGGLSLWELEAKQVRASLRGS